MLSLPGKSEITNYWILSQMSYFSVPDLISSGDINVTCSFRCFSYSSSIVFLALLRKIYFLINDKVANKDKFCDNKIFFYAVIW